MQKNGLFIAAVLFIAFAAMVNFLPQKTTTNDHEKLHIVTTTSMIADAIEAIGKDTVAVITLMGPGVDPHSYHARLSDMYKLINADLIFYNGLHLEGKMTTMLHKMKQQPTYAIADALDRALLIASEEFGGIYDPHIWFDVSLWKQVILYIADTLSKHNPIHANLYKQRATDYLDQLQSLEQYIHQRIACIPEGKRYLITTHDAFSYFGRAYGMNVLGLQGINLNAEPSIKDMQKMVQFICQKQIPAIFVESALPHRSIQAIKQAAASYGWQVRIGDELYSDALGKKGHQAGTYIGMLKYNIDTITHALCQA